MKLSVAEALFEVFPEARIGLLVARDVDNHADEAEAAHLEEMLRAAQARALEELGGSSVTEHPHIRCWREAYRAFGAKPKKHPSSIESLVRRAVKGDPPRHINKLVDLYNVVSLSHVLPAGGEDLDALEGDVELTRAGSDEPAIQLLGDAEERAPTPGEVIYRDERGAICRRWNWREAERTKLTPDTRGALLVLESLPPIEPSKLSEALAELASLVTRHTGARVSESVLDRASPSAALD